MSVLPGLVIFLGGLIGTMLVLGGSDLGDFTLAFPAAAILGVVLIIRAIRQLGR